MKEFLEDLGCGSSWESLLDLSSASQRYCMFKGTELE